MDVLEPEKDWWERAFSRSNAASRSGEWAMLIIVAYDICDPRRLHRVARFCKDFGGRIQYSVFELHLTSDEFEVFWKGLLKRIDERTDRVVAYRICRECADKIRTGGTMTVTKEPPPAYIV